MLIKKTTIIAATLYYAVSAWGADLVLQFDDGYANWVETVAPLIQQAGGTATGFINNQYITSDRITLDQIRQLRDEYGWEIGTHAYTHTHAPRFVRQHGLDAWIEQQLVKSMTAFAEQGIDIQTLVFPFNAYTDELAAAVTNHVQGFRRRDNVPLSSGIRPDGSFPGAPLDIAQYAPVDRLIRWIDMAVRTEQDIFFYAHRVLPDDLFQQATVMEVHPDYLVIDRELELDTDGTTTLVPDIRRSQMHENPLYVMSVEGKKLFVEGGDLTRLTRPGAEMMTGPSYGIRESDFMAVLKYAASRCRFVTVSDYMAAHRAKN